VDKVKRDIGKRAELGCGYGAGGNALRRMVAKEAGFDLDTVIDADLVVKAWRTLHSPIVRFWYQVERAFRAATDGRTTHIGPFQFMPSGANIVAAILPSGRPIMYNDVELHEGHGIEFLGVHGREYTYGGKLVENLIQAMCRDLLATVLVKMERDGLAPIMHVHDEPVGEVPEQAGAEGYAWLKKLMHELPGWAAGFPIGASGFWGKRYRK
jgi:DNA polymerase bacteriophage-type